MYFKLHWKYFNLAYIENQIRTLELDGRGPKHFGSRQSISRHCYQNHSFPCTSCSRKTHLAKYLVLIHGAWDQFFSIWNVDPEKNGKQSKRIVELRCACILFKTFVERIVTLESQISLLKIENWATFFEDWLNFHSSERDSKESTKSWAIYRKIIFITLVILSEIENRIRTCELLSYIVEKGH